MPGPVTFRSCTLGHRDLAFIGDRPIGYVVDYHGGINVKAFWRCTLFDDNRQRPATSRAVGRHRLLLHAAEWFEGTGIDDLTQLASDLRTQAEAEGG